MRTDTGTIKNDVPGGFPVARTAAAAGLRFRAEEESDLPFLATLYRSTREAELSMTPWSEAEKQGFIDMQFRAQRTHYRQHYPEALWMIIEAHGEAVGRLYLAYWPREHRVVDIALVPAARGQGFGSAILADLIADATARGKPVSIHVEKTNPAMSLYRRFGFLPVEDKGVYDLLRRPLDDRE